MGEGNVGSHLAKAFSQKGFDVTTMSSRRPILELTGADIVIIAVHDDAIPDIARKVAEAILREKNRNIIVAHTSGSVPISVLEETLPENSRFGVFYPMQTFSKHVDMRYDDIPFLIEGSDNYTLTSLKNLASEISVNVIEADSDIRKDYHIGAVFACNFANHLWTLSDKYLSSKGLPFGLLKPLLRQTIAKLDSTSPFEAQTGPAVRHDERVMQAHLSHLSDIPEMNDLYRLLSQSIENLHK